MGKWSSSKAGHLKKAYLNHSLQMVYRFDGWSIVYKWIIEFSIVYKWSIFRGQHLDGMFKSPPDGTASYLYAVFSTCHLGKRSRWKWLVVHTPSDMWVAFLGSLVFQLVNKAAEPLAPQACWLFNSKHVPHAKPIMNSCKSGFFTPTLSVPLYYHVLYLP